MVEALENRIRMLREESERQKRFVAAFTRELKTPMTAILGYAGLLRSATIPSRFSAPGMTGKSASAWMTTEKESHRKNFPESRNRFTG